MRAPEIWRNHSKKAENSLGIFEKIRDRDWNSDESLIYQTPMSIAEAPLEKILLVRSFHESEDRSISDLESRLMHLGFFYGERIKITHRAPLFKEPFLVEVRGRLVALSKEEAQLVDVEVME